MTDSSPFDHRPDSELGSTLRDLLTAADDAAFVQRVMAALPPPGAYSGSPEWWRVLGEWARPGLAAAVTLAAASVVLLLAMGGNQGGRVTLEDQLRPAGEVALLASADPPDVSMILDRQGEN